MAKKAKRVALAKSARKLPKGAKRLGAADPKQHIEISVRLRTNPAAGLSDNAILSLGAKPTSERQYVTREDFAARAGASPDDVAKIDDFAHQHGLNVKSVHLGSRIVKLTGSVKAFSSAFGVRLSKVRHDGSTYRMRTGSVMIPDDLKNIVVGVHGLDDRPVARPHFRLGKRGAKRGAKGRTTARATAANGSFAVNQIATLYNFPTNLDGSGQCIAIIELNDIDSKGRAVGAGYNTSDLSAFFRGAGITMPSIASVSVDGGANLPGKSEADGEVALDIEVAGAIAPGAKIAVYFTPNTTNGFIDAVNAAAHDAVRKPSVISISWGGPEDPSGSQQFLDGLNAAVRDAAAMGVTVCIAAGDNGSADMSDGWDGVPHADFPASSPFALGCGGTKLTASNGVITDEVVWNEGPQDGAGGGGVSVYFALPAYQNSANVPKAPTNFTGRGVPDVAGDADPLSGYNIYLDGSTQTIGGTSAVAPLMAGLIALINQATTQKFGKTVGLINPVIYNANGNGVFRDITDGNNDIEGDLNGLYTAGAGWDACSGLGVPNGTALLNLLNQ